MDPGATSWSSAACSHRRRSPISPLVIVTCTALGWLTCVKAHTPASDEDFAFAEKFVVRLSSYKIENADTTLTVLSEQGVGAGISFNDSLGGDDEATIPRLDVYYRFNERHRVQLSHFRVERSGSREIDVDITIGEQEFKAGDIIKSELDYDLFAVGYGYSFFHSDEIEFSLSAGLNFTTYEFNRELSDGRSQSGSDVTAPLPMFGIAASYAFDRHWSFHILSETFFFELDDKLKGSLQNFELNLQYRFSSPFILGIGTTRVSTDLEASDSNWKGRVSDSHHGYLLFVSLYLK